MTPDATEVSAVISRLELDNAPSQFDAIFGKLETIYRARIDELERENKMLKLAVTNFQGHVAALTPLVPVVKRWWQR